MHVKLSLFRHDGSAQDVVVTAEPTATVRDIAARIAAADPRRSYDPARAYTLQTASPLAPEWRLLPPDAVIGDEWLASGLSVALVDEVDAAGVLPTLHAGLTATVTVLGGPQGGQAQVLGRGSHTVGRDPSSDVVISDPYLSKRHLRIDVGQTVEVVDLGSANGIEVDGELVSRIRVNDALVVFAGSTELSVSVQTHAASRGDAAAAPVEFNRSPRVEERYAGREFPVPEVPSESDDQPFPLLAMIAPVLLGGAMFAMTGRPITLLFIAMTPVMLVGSWITTRRRDKRKLGRQVSRFDEGLADLGARLEAEKVVEQRARNAEIPSSDQLVETAATLGPALWTRRPEHWNFLSLRLGSSSMTSRNTIDAQQRGDLLFEFQDRLDALVDAHRMVDDVPIVVDLSEAGALGVAGTTDAAAGVLAAVTVQLTALHSPAELVIAAALTPEWATELDWLKWLPHTSSPHSPLSGNHLAATSPAAATLTGDLEALITARERDRRSKEASRGAMAVDRSAMEAGARVGTTSGGDGQYAAPIPAVVVFIADGATRDRARLVDLAERGADVGVFPVWVSRDVAQLPAVCRAFVALDADGGARVGLVRLGEEVQGPRLDRVDPAAASGFARGLSRVVDANVPVDDVSDLPTSVSLLTVIDPELLDRADAVVERWWANESIVDRTRSAAGARRRAGRLRAAIGQGALGTMHLDLRTQGPHALVGGTTGSGKSEFLQAWVLGMAAEYSPDRVTFLFVDYKGGSAFADCVKLPHTVGLVTDLTPHLVRRALTSLRAELHHREELLHRKGAKDLLELEKRGDPDAPPALVLIIDEFAALVGEVPEFVDGVVDIAQRGRSLGIHLVMATQRPAGVIRDNLRANTNLRIALRMADEADSLDVVGEKDAAHFDPSIPGRAIAKTGPGRLERFQSGYAGGWLRAGVAPSRVDVADMPFGVAAAWAAPSDEQAPEEKQDLGPTDQQRMVETMIQAARGARIPAPRRPWLDELPEAVDLRAIRARTDERLPIGVADLPERQAQEVVAFQPDVDGHLAVFGTGGAGKSVALRTIAEAAALADESEVFVYGLDFGAGGLRALEELPGVGAVITGEDDERIVRLFRMLRTELERRTREFADARATSITEFRRGPGRAAEPRLILLIDNFPGFRDDWEIPAGRNEWYKVFQDVVALGRPLGLHVALSTDRFASLPSAIAAGIQRRVVLRLADDTGYAALDVPNDVLSEDSAPGRSVVGGRETQLAILGGSRLAADQSTALADLASRLRAAGASAAPGIPSLPAVVRLTALPDTRDGEIVIGLAEETLEPATIPLTGAFVVAGPPGSGRSNAMAVIAERAFALPGHAVYHIGPRRSALAGDRRFAATADRPEEVAELARILKEVVGDPAAESRVVVLIESIGDFLQTPADTPLVDLVRQIKREEHFVAAEAESSSWVSSWPLFGEFKNSRRGLLLQPDQSDGDVILKTSLARAKRADFPEGRGVVVSGGRTRRVQIALVEASALVTS